MSALRRVVLVASDPVRDRVRPLLRTLPITVVAELEANLASGELVSMLQPDLVLLESRQPREPLLGPIQHAAPRCEVALLLSEAFTPASRCEALRLDDEVELRRRLAQLSEPEARALPDAATADVLTVYGPRAGCGASTLAVNLAVLLAQDGTRPVHLLDGAGPEGDLDLMLNLSGGEPARSQRHASGLELEVVADAEQLGRRLGELAGRDAWVVVDAHPADRSGCRLALEAARRIVVPVRLELGSLRALQRELARWRDEGCELARAEVWAWGDRSDISPEDAAHMLRHPIAGLLPYDPQGVRRALNLGTPLALSDPSGGFARQLKAMLNLESLSTALVPVRAPGALGALWAWLRRGPSASYGG